MNRFSFLKILSPEVILLTLLACLLIIPLLATAAPENSLPFLETPQGKDWLVRWENNIIESERSRYCDKELGEELGWLVSPYLNGFYYGYRATHDPKWIDLLIDWADACIRRGIEEPDGFIGWPKGNGGGGKSSIYTADSLLGEAMLMRPIVLMAGIIQNDPILNEKYGDKARSYIDLTEQLFEKWDSRDCWREVKEGGVWIVPAFGIDRETGQWSAGYTDRKKTGFTNPDNKENHIAQWMLAMYDVTLKTVYRERAEKWFHVMKSRIQSSQDRKYLVWNYWEPAGPWDYKPDGSTAHWVGVHPNGGYYKIDLEGIVSAYEHGIVFTKADIDRLIATNRDFMWNQKINDARFQRIDGGQPDKRWENSPGVLWDSLIPYDETLRRIFIANHDPSSWGGLVSTPRFLSGVDCAPDQVGSHSHP